VTVPAPGSGSALPPIVTVPDPASSLVLTPTMGPGGAAGTVVGLTITTPGYLRATDTIIFTPDPDNPVGSGADATFVLESTIPQAELPAHLRVDGGTGVVCGDIIADGTITALDAAVISVDGSMAYLSAIRVGDMSQVDAQATGGVRFDPLPTNAVPAVTDLSIKGGEIDASVNFRYVQESRIWHQGYGEQQAGVYRGSVAAFGTPAIGYVTLQDFSGALVRVSVSFLIQGVGAGVVVGEYAVTYGNSGNAVVTPAPSHPWASTGFTAATIASSVSGRTVTFYANLTGASLTGNQVNGTIEMIGGRGLLKRGVE